MNFRMRSPTDSLSLRSLSSHTRSTDVNCMEKLPPLVVEIVFGMVSPDLGRPHSYKMTIFQCSAQLPSSPIQREAPPRGRAPSRVDPRSPLRRLGFDLHRGITLLSAAST